MNSAPVCGARLMNRHEHIPSRENKLYHKKLETIYLGQKEKRPGRGLECECVCTMNSKKCEVRNGTSSGAGFLLLIRNHSDGDAGTQVAEKLRLLESTSSTLICTGGLL